jgi:hypothetical protein
MRVASTKVLERFRHNLYLSTAQLHETLREE